VAFWSGEKLLNNRSVVEDFDDNQVDTNAYNFRMGNCYFVTGDGGSDGKQTKVFLTEGEPFLIPPGQFAYLMSKERFDLPPNAMAFISMRTGIKFQGLINISGFHVDPGYKGKLIFAAYNASPSPIQICEGDPIFKIWFADLDRTSEEKFLFDGDGQSEISNNLIRGMSKEIYSLQSMTVKIQTLEQKLDQKLAEQKPIIASLTSLWSAISTGVVLAIIGAVFVLVFPMLMSGGSWLEDKLFGEEPSIEVEAPEEEGE
jgi:dCTP deaminase